MKKFLATVAAVILSLAMVAVPSVAAVAGDDKEDKTPKPDLLCTDITDGTYSTKVDVNANDPVTVSIPAGYTLVAYCVKSGTEPIIIDSNDDAPSDGTLPFVGPGNFVIDHPNKDSVSHYQLKLVATAPTSVTPDASFVDESCDVETDVLTKGVITVDLTKVGVTYSITQNGNPVAFDAVTGKTGPLTAGLTYIVTAAANSGYVLSGPYEEQFTPTDDSEDCDGTQLITVAPDASFVDESCDVETDVLTKGVITVDLTKVGVTYSITQNGNPVAFDAVTGKTGELVAGLTYIVTATPNTGYKLSGPYEERFTPFSAAVDCGTLGLVSPQASQDPGCELPSFFTIGNSDSDPAALTWTANGNKIAEGTHVVNGPITINLVAAANGPEYGLEKDAQTLWTFVFPADETCGDLTTLALSGSNTTTPALALTALLGLLGLAMVRSGMRDNRIREEV